MGRTKEWRVTEYAALPGAVSVPDGCELAKMVAVLKGRAVFFLRDLGVQAAGPELCEDCMREVDLSAWYAVKIEEVADSE